MNTFPSYSKYNIIMHRSLLAGHDGFDNMALLRISPLCVMDGECCKVKFSGRFGFRISSYRGL